ncbi:MAG: nitronate monooxygenase [Desulfomicrobium escambiense]|nr:nitronate monooxygenase [Desulfomicrobium escambiense]
MTNSISSQHKLENLLPQVKDVAKKYGDFPVIAAGGIFDRDDILRFIALGADGVQMGTRFLATEECSATPSYKKAVVKRTARMTSSWLRNQARHAECLFVS